MSIFSNQYLSQLLVLILNDFFDFHFSEGASGKVKPKSGKGHKKTTVAYVSVFT